MRFSASVLVASSILLLSAFQASAGPTVQIVGVQRIQPGWVRVYLSTSGAPSNAQLQLTVSCAAPTDTNSVSIAPNAGRVPEIDIKANAVWLGENSLPQPCHITHLAVAMVANQPGTPVTVYDQALQDVDIPMDLPLSLITPANTPITPNQGSVSLVTPQTYAAYPPIIVAIQSATGLLGFAEVEELSGRGTVGLRGLAVFSGSYLVSELGGGAEMEPNWGLDINSLGIWAGQSAIETTNPGHDTFPYTSTAEPPIFALNPASLEVFPYPPLHTLTEYQTYVLNNRGARRCQQATGCMDVTYGANNSLVAVNGAQLALVTPGPIVLGAQTNLAGLTRGLVVRSAARDLAVSLPVPAMRTILAAPPAEPFKVTAVSALSPRSAAIIPNLDPVVSKRLFEAASQLANTRGGGFSAVLKMPTALAGSSAHMKSNAITRDRSRFPESPQESKISRLHYGTGGHPTTYPTASCVLSTVSGTLVATQQPSGCNGMNASRFTCPTLSSPIAVEQITSTTAQSAALTATIPPYYAGRDNLYGDCETHAEIQFIEALLDKYTDDLAIKRVIYVNGDPIVVPEPRVALSPEGFLTQLYTWDGTQVGDHNPWTPVGNQMPIFPDAYWPAREGNWATWQATAGQQVTPPCGPSFWASGFCMGQGHPAQGVYRTHTNMIQTLNGDPLSDPPWSVANTYFGLVAMPPIPIDSNSINAVIAQIQLGLPVELGFNDSPTATTQVVGGGTLESYFTGMTWYIPPELGACTTAQLNQAFAPGGGHAVDIIGYWLSGNFASPNPFNSYFILEGNWGKTAGYNSFFFMNFAAFNYLANSLQTYRLPRSCWSVACEYQPSTVPLGCTSPNVSPCKVIQQLLYPPDPQSASAPAYSNIVNDAQAQLPGVRTTSSGSGAPK